MADSDWKKRTGVEINYSTDDSDPESDSNSTPSTEEGTLDAYMRDFEKLGTTPPRTRILQRHREKLKEKKEICEKNVCRTGSIDHGSLYIAGSRDSAGDSAVEIRKRVSKRNMQRLRGSERDLKLNIGNPASHSQQDRTESLPTMKVESSNRFLSLSCKLVKNAVHWRKVQPEGSRSRTEFHEKIVTILKSGNTEVKDKNCRHQVSRAEDLWQAELKDLIWLELQAWHADRTPVEQDCYICDARKSVPQLLIDILNYRFEKKPEQFSTQSSDSGIHLPSPENETIVEDKCDPCPGCLWLFCPRCIEHENIALREVETLLSRLESAESLYPSSRAFADEYPLYKSAEFLNRVKAMCLWYNVTKHHRLKLLILGKQLLYYTKGSEVAGIFTVSSEGVTSLLTNPYEFNLVSQDFYNTQPLTSMGKNLNQFDSDHTHSYRKYIEDVLKIRGLRKALYFLEQLHLTVLRKARISLEKQNNKEANEKQEDLEEFELHRYGYWSVEAQSLNLPSYRPAFLFISRIPLDVIHEFLRMRLETKVDRPSALSIRQLIKELKEGLSLAVLHKERYLQHVNTALCEEQQEALSTFNNTILSFDNSVKSVLELYLNYLEQWVSLAQHERVQKNILEEEWKFVMSTVPHIPGGHSVSGNSFCNIATSMLSTICDELKQKVNELVDTHLGKDLDTSLKQCFLFLCRDVQTLCLDMRDRTLRVISLAKILHKHLDTEEFSNCSIISDSLANIKGEILHMSECLREVILSVEHRTHSVCLEESDNPTLLSRCREVLHQMYKFTFEYHKEVCRFFVGGEQCLVARGMITFAQQWLNFVITRCEKGKGVRPRWSNHGFDFLVHISDPKYTDYLTDEEFEEFKTLTEKAVAHIMGVATPTTTTTTPRSYMSTRARSSSPSPTIVKHKISFSNATENQQFVVILDEMNKQTLRERTLIETKIGNRRHRIKSAVRRLENERDSRLKNANLIGNVAATPNSQNERDLIRPRSVTFAWQRGIKIGQGRFGKVYTAVNNHSGELMAMKEISLQPNDLRTIRNVALELKIFEGLQHQHLVRYYGAEVRREELLIFMELCTEGTLESLVAATEGGLPEALIRRYTNQLVSAISALHQHSIVHRDIKTANIFLTAEGNCLKLGDFGSAVKIKAHTTVPGELKGFVGTQAYMAPEVFTKTHTEGHGRAADIWSLGCVIIEMASGIRPWSEYDSNYQIMFKVGMGEIPTIPDSLSDEGRHLVLQCLKHNPKERATTLQIKSHTFLKVDTEEECLSCTMPSVLEDYLKLGIKR